LYATGLAGQCVFLSASFPQGERAHKFPEADPFEITAAIVALAKSVFGAKGKLVFGGHPTISPLVLSIGRDFTLFCNEQETPLDLPLVYIYQSEFFRKDIPKETLQLEKERIGEIIWVKSENADREQSLLKMREKMLREPKPIAGVFVGGMDGVYDIQNHQYNDEFYLFTKYCKGKPLYPIGKTGGASQVLVNHLLRNPQTMDSWQYFDLKPQELAQPMPYSVLTKKIVQDIIKNTQQKGKYR
jgi:hypothetical protein